MKISTFALAGLAVCVSIITPPVAGQDVQERVIRFGHLNNPDHPVSMGVKKFAELVAAKSGGKLQVKEFPSNQLGTEQQQTSALQGGVQEMQAPATTSLVGIVKDYGVIDFPFTVSTHAQAFALLDGPLGKALLEKLPEKGLIGLAYWDLGFRNVTDSKRPITRPEDLDGLKLRVIPNPVFLDTFKAFKASPVPMSFSELYTALETKTVDGQENPYAVILSNKFYEVQKYVSGTNHVARHEHHPDEQEILGQAFAGGAEDPAGLGDRGARLPAPGEPGCGGQGRRRAHVKGMLFNEVSPAERERMREISKPVTEQGVGDVRSCDPEAVHVGGRERIQSSSGPVAMAPVR